MCSIFSEHAMFVLLVCSSNVDTTLLLAIPFLKVLIFKGANQAIFFLFNIALGIIGPLFYMDF